MAGCIDPACLHAGARAAAQRAARRHRIAEIMAPRRRATRHLDRLLGLDRPPAGWRECDGAHHPDLGCDWYGPCSGAAYTVDQHRRLRAEVAA